jgi:cellulose synthase/poly-beta-1,6-N-acetylglucosamine synthase-like glycosyltransferase
MLQLLFWGSVGVIFYIYAGYPALLYVSGKLRKLRPVIFDRDTKPSVCLIISAFNEEKVIRDKIENSLSLQYPADKLTILVASDGSTDLTVDIVKEYADQDVTLYHRPSRQGKSAVLNEVVNKRTEDLIVFTDANALFARNALSMLARNFGDPRVGCVVGRLRYVNRETSSVSRAEGAYWKYEGIMSRLESALKSVLVANGSIFAIRRKDFQELYPEVANDFQIPIDIASRGLGVIYEPEAEATEHTTGYWREEFQRKVRIILRGLTGFSMLRHKIHRFQLWQFWSHKLLRWMVGLFLAVTFVSGAALAASSPVYLVLFAGQVLFYAFAMVGLTLRNAHKPRKLFYIPFYFTVVNCAAMTGILKFMAGQRLTVWDKAESTRLTAVPPLQADLAAEPDTEPSRSVSSEKAPRPRAKVAKN